MEELLRSWNVDPNTINKFIGEEIGLKELQCLTEADYSHFFRKLGPKVSFRVHLEEWQKTFRSSAAEFKDSCHSRQSGPFMNERVSLTSSSSGFFGSQFRQNDSIQQNRSPSPILPEKYHYLSQSNEVYPRTSSGNYPTTSYIQNRPEIYSATANSYPQSRPEEHLWAYTPQSQFEKRPGTNISQSRYEERPITCYPLTGFEKLPTISVPQNRFENHPWINSSLTEDHPETSSPHHKVAIQSKTSYFQNLDENHLIIDSTQDNYSNTDENEFKQCLRTTEELRQLLNDSLTGKQILCNFKSTDKLTNSHKNKIAKIVINHELQCFPRQKLSADRLIFLCHLLCEQFPNTEPALWYSHPKSEPNGERSNTRGKLHIQYLHLRKQLIKSGLTERIRAHKKRRTTEVNAEVSSTTHLSNEISKPFLQVAATWQETYQERKNLWRIRYKNVDEYYLNYPILEQNFGLDLLLSDFKQAYPNKVDNLLSRWPKFKEILLGFCQRKTITDRTFLKNVAEAGINLLETEDRKSTVNALKLLAILLPYCVTIRGNNKEWKPERKDVIEGTFLQVSGHAELESCLDAKKKHYQEFGLTFPPLPVFIVNNDSVRDCYVANSKTRYRVGSPIQAVDACFKSYHVLNAKYPSEAKLVWTFIQNVLYDVKPESVKLHMRLLNLQKDLKNFEKALESEFTMKSLQDCP